MADNKNGGNLAWAALATIGALALGSQIPQQPFEKLRPAEKVADAARPSAGVIEARLWEDPFAAVRREDASLGLACEKGQRPSLFFSQRLRCDLAGAPLSYEVKPPTADAPTASSLLLAVTVQGGPFLGADETRRRMRVAVLSALQSAGYVPEDAQRLHVVTTPTVSLREPAASAPSAAASAPILASAASAPASQVKSSGQEERYRLPYERWNMEAGAASPGRYSQVTVLWVDESRLPAPHKLHGLARLLALSAMSAEIGRPVPVGKKAPCDLPDVAVIGPSSTDVLQSALLDLAAGTASPAATALAVGNNRSTSKNDDEIAPDQRAGACIDLNLGNDRAQVAALTQLGYGLLSRGRVFNAASTVPADLLSGLPTPPPIGRDPLEAFVGDQLRVLGAASLLNQSPPDSASATALPSRYQRTIATDDKLVALLLDELTARVDLKKRRIVLLAERDTQYARSMVTLIERGLAELRRNPDAASTPPVAPYKGLTMIHYFSGLDGVTGKEPVADNIRRDASKAELALIEWPEGGSQLDSLRRVAASLRHSETDGDHLPIGAIGVLGSDVHDKLLVLQALHDSFSDKVFFTTDMDARLLHPRALPFTRNLIVAGSLPLELPEETTVLVGSGRVSSPLRAGTPPLRDAYQTAAFLAVRGAVCADDSCRKQEYMTLQSVLARPQLYELGRNRAVPLDDNGRSLRLGKAYYGQDLIAAMLLVLAFVAWVLWPSTPSLQHLRRYLRQAKGAPAPDGFNRLMVALHGSLMVYVVGTMAMFLHPTRLSYSTLVSGSVLTGLALLYWLRSLVQARASLAAGAKPPPRSYTEWLICGLLLGLLLLATIWPEEGGKGCAKCEPVAWLEGVSAWPSHWLHSLALVLTLAALDHVWDGGWRGLLEDQRDLGLDPQAAQRGPAAREWRTFVRLRGFNWRRFSLLGWRRVEGPSNLFLRLWQQFRLRSSAWPRAARLLLAYLLTLGLTITGFITFSGGVMPEVPVRGIEHKRLVSTTLTMLLFLFPLLVVAATDAAALVYRFVGHLNVGRSVYPKRCLRRFADELGTPGNALWLRGIQAAPQDRAFASAARDTGMHTLLDDWIDMKITASSTARVSAMVLGPFVVLAVMVVARSRVFDNWAITPIIIVTVGVYLLGLIGISLALRHTAETGREQALLSMQADLIWLRGSGESWQALVPGFEGLIEQVRQMRTGAFAGVLDQPLLKALLLPAAGVAATQLADYVLQLN